MTATPLELLSLVMLGVLGFGFIVYLACNRIEKAIWNAVYHSEWIPNDEPDDDDCDPADRWKRGGREE